MDETLTTQRKNNFYKLIWSKKQEIQRELGLETIEETSAYFDVHGWSLPLYIDSESDWLPEKNVEPIFVLPTVVAEVNEYESKAPLYNHYDLVIFFDRDGVLNINTHYPHHSSDVWIPEAVITALADLSCSRLDVRMFIITNQLGVARGLYTKDDCLLFEKCLRYDLSPYKWLNSPTIWRHAWTSDVAKPNPHLFLEVIKEHNLDVSKCIALGDKQIDLDAAHAAGIEHTKLTSCYTLDQDLPVLIEEWKRDTRTD